MKTLLAVLALFVAVPALAQASPPTQGPIRVLAEPPGPNCTAGGIKVIVPKLPQDDIFYICNGVIGPVGPQGPAGPAGPTGPQGPQGPQSTPCTTTLGVRQLGRLPKRFHVGLHVTIRINGHTQHGVVGPGRNVPINLRGLPCGVYPIVVNDNPNSRSIRPVMRIWDLTGGNGVQRIGFPLPVPPIGLS